MNTQEDESIEKGAAGAGEDYDVDLEEVKAINGREFIGWVNSSPNKQMIEAAVAVAQEIWQEVLKQEHPD